MTAIETAAAHGEPAPGGFGRLKKSLRDAARGALAPLVGVLARMGVKPDWLTIIGAALSFTAAIAFFEGGFRWGSLLLALSGVCDILDGQLARTTGFESKFGAFLDSVLDRLSEGLVYAGIAGYYLMHVLELAHSPTMVLEEMSRGLEPSVWARVALLSVLALVGSFLVSYTRARAEGLGLECKVGWAERPERLITLMIAGCFGVGRVMVIALILLTLMSFVTAGQRVAYVWRTSRGVGRSAAGPGRQ
jgi:CDP-diacylglycerol---glycerol-3-phosphate 3-phosphatidyltransferase